MKPIIRMDRRDLIKAAGGIALLAGFARTPLFAQALGANPFTLGVAAGDPWPDGFVIWTRLAPRPLEEHGGMPTAHVPVRWEVAEDEGFARVVRKGETMALPELAHSVHVEVEGLQPHRPYWYRFAVAGSDVSPVGMARTAPARDALAQRLRIGVAGCQHYEMGFYDAWAHLADEPDLDLIFHYGDYIYEGAGTPPGQAAATWTPVRQHIGNEIYSIEDYRRRYAQYKSDPALQAAHAACAFAASFDDHEIDNNWAGDFDQDGTSPAIFALRRYAGLQAWYEHMPVRKAQFPTTGGLTAYRRLDYGRLLRTHVLDTRSYRSDQPCNDGKITPCPTQAHNAPEMLGKAQEAWLDAGLGNQATWNLLAQQVIVMPVDFRASDAAEARFATDLWDGYRPARARLIESIRKHDLTNVIIATGDHHRHLVGSVPESDDRPDGRKVAVEFQAASITSNGNGKGEAGLEHMMRNNPHFALYTDRRGYQLFDITAKEWTTSVKVMDQVEKPGGKITTLAKYAVTPDAPVLHHA
ncbi:alkaline phosphatase D family protein [Novosphingobium album (ex Liu et al. 2023)]|uniref:Alkaline phosphatase D family protein n=1 Tax=Novosphingobium album (ex Liu et al. 2023) TaxID=3031130 RepID=A0ABT5WME4_9SPHN|nr:alkaline phosphatase D family protein [Novosphingobium album (ex Liu et al. 2023)]MDE8651216.1 alkaline phosphatase D family protein [Novosphingobium album (ex Liu et al. 2023)]